MAARVELESKEFMEKSLGSVMSWIRAGDGSSAAYAAWRRLWCARHVVRSDVVRLVARNQYWGEAKLLSSGVGSRRTTLGAMRSGVYGVSLARAALCENITRQDRKS